jgi:hypothetical protein
VEQAKCYVIDTRKMRKELANQLSSRGTIVKVAGVSCVLFFGLPDATFASGTGIDAGATKIYAKLINVGKWVIIVKGGIDTIRSVAEGDVNTAKKNFLGYVVTYAILWALPWALGEVDKLFTNMDTAG